MTITQELCGFFQMLFITNLNKDQIGDTILFLEVTTSFQGAMRRLDHLMLDRDIRTDKGVNILSVLMIHFLTPSFSFAFRFIASAWCPMRGSNPRRAILEIAALASELIGLSLQYKFWRGKSRTYRLSQPCQPHNSQ